MILADTHCHLYLESFDDDLEAVLQRAAGANVVRIYLPSIDWNSLEQMEKLVHPQITFYKMAGIHPCSVQDIGAPDEERLFRLVSGNEFVAVGETGLDYYRNREHAAEQKRSLDIHCRVAKQLNKPVILHNRDSTADLLDLIETQQDGTLKGVWHCFTGTRDQAARALDAGLYLGIGGIVTFKNAGLDKVAGTLPADRLLLETDAPYLAPVPKRGKRNEPSYLRYTAEKLAAVLDMPVEEVARITTSNSADLFGTEK